MCQTNVFIEKDGENELVLENVTELEVTETSLLITSLFEGTKEFEGAQIKRIDFASGKVYLLQ